MLLLKGETGKINLNLANDLAASIGGSPAAIVRLDIENLDLEGIVSTLNVESDDFIPDRIVGIDCIFGRVTITLNRCSNLSVGCSSESGSELSRID